MSFPRFRGLAGAFALLLMAMTTLAAPSNALAQDGENDGVRVMNYNIKHGQGNDDCEDPETEEGELPETQCAVDLDRTAELIASYEPDIVALQEVDRFWARSGGVDQPAELANALDMNACFGANLDHEADDHADEPHQYGTAILSVYPIVSCENTFLPTPEGWEQRGLLEVRVEIDGVGEVAILNTHLQAGREGEQEEAVRQRTEQAEAIAERVAEIDVPLVLMGDFNAQPDDEDLESLFDPELGLQDVWEVAGDEDSDGFTSPASPDEDAERRIDYIFVSEGVEVLSVEVPVTEETRITADHYPIIADLRFGGPPAATPIVDAQPIPTDEPQGTPEPTVIIAPTVEPTEEPQPTVEPTEDVQPTTEPTEDAEPTVEATDEPEPTAEPTEDAEPTMAPEPTVEATEED